MVRDFLGCLIILVCALPIGLEIPGFTGTETYYLLMIFAFSGGIYGTSLILSSDNREVVPVRLPQLHGTSPQAVVMTMARAQKYADQQIQRDGNRAKALAQESLWGRTQL